MGKADEAREIKVYERGVSAQSEGEKDRKLKSVVCAISNQ